MIGFGIIGTLFAYEGWTNLNTVAGEMKNVKRDLPRAILSSTLLVMIVYVLFIFSIYRVLPFALLEQIATTENYFPMVAMYNLYGDAGLNFVFFAVLISIFGALNGSVMVFPRTYYAMAKDGVFFSAFGKVDKKYQTPSIAIFGSLPFIFVLKISLAEPIMAIPPYTSLLKWSDSWLPSIAASLDSYLFLFSDSLYIKAYLSSLKIAIISTILTLIIGYSIAYSVARAPTRWRGILLMLVILPFWTSFLIRVYAWIGILKTEGLLNLAISFIFT